MSLGELTDPPADLSVAGVRQIRQEERRRLSCDLHDTLGPALASIRLRLDTAAARLAHEPEVRRLIVGAAEETARTVEEIRRIIGDLGPVDLHWGLAGALRRLAARLDEGGDVTVRVEMPDSAPPLPTAVEVTAYRIAAEGLTNVVRHAAAGQVTVRLALDHDDVVLEIADDGVGLLDICRTRGLGLSSMTRRAEAIGGRCDVLPRADGRSGTLVRAVLPGQAA